MDFSRGLDYRASRSRRILARLLTTRAVGHVAAAIFRDRIPSRGVGIDTAHPVFDPRTKARILVGVYESAEIRLVRRHLRGAKRVVELGSCLGVVSAHLLDVMDPDGDLTCVEANPALAEALPETLSAVRSAVHFRVIHAALGYGSPSVRLSLADDRVGSQLTKSEGEGERTVEVPARSLSSILRGVMSTEDEFCLVADIEGSEIDLLDNEPDVLLRCSRIVVELHQGPVSSRSTGLSALVQRFERLGFRLVEAHGPVAYLARDS